MQLAAAPRDALQHCQTTGGDCLIAVADLRDELVSRDYLNACRDPDPEKQAPCVIHELEQSGSQKDLAAYYERENWCSRKLLECTAAWLSDAAEAATRTRGADRRAEVESAATSLSAASAPMLAKDKAGFMRSLLPPRGQEGCATTEPEYCERALNGPSARFDTELAQDPASYDPGRARDAYAALQQAHAECYAPELNCLLATFPLYGGSPESDKLLQQNLSLLTKQWQLKTSVELDAADACLSEGVIQYSDRIVSAYQTYAKGPTASSLVRLQKGFVDLHLTQLECLSQLDKLK